MECLTCSVKEAAKILGVSPDYIRQMDGKTLPRLTKLKGTIRFALKDVLACADETEAAIRPSELKRLKMELESAQNENQRLRNVIRSICAAANIAAVQEKL